MSGLTHGALSPRSFKCVCGRIFGDFVELGDHMDLFHYEGVCREKTGKTKKCPAHLCDVHENHDTKHWCSQCGKEWV